MIAHAHGKELLSCSSRFSLWLCFNRVPIDRSAQPREEGAPAHESTAGITESETIGSRIRRQAHAAQQQQQQASLGAVTNEDVNAGGDVSSEDSGDGDDDLFCGGGDGDALNDTDEGGAQTAKGGGSELEKEDAPPVSFFCGAVLFSRQDKTTIVTACAVCFVVVVVGPTKVRSTESELVFSSICMATLCFQW